jgi:hypothetical protein
LREGSPEVRAIKAWVDNLPYRWAAAGGISIGVILGTLTLSGTEAPWIEVTLLLAGMVTASIGWLLLGYWARRSVRYRLQQSFEVARASIPDLWASGAILLAGLPLVLRQILAELGMIKSPGSTLGGLVELVVVRRVLFY